MNKRVPQKDGVNPSEIPRAEEFNGNFKLKSQTLEIEVDFRNEFISGYSELVIQPVSPNILYIKINARNIDVKKVEVNGQECEFKYNLFKDSLDSIRDFKTPSFSEDFNRDLINLIRSHEEGELEIMFPGSGGKLNSISRDIKEETADRSESVATSPRQVVFGQKGEIDSSIFTSEDTKSSATNVSLVTQSNYASLEVDPSSDITKRISEDDSESNTRRYNVMENSVADLAHSNDQIYGSQTQDTAGDRAEPVEGLPALTIRVYYELSSPTIGAHFNIPSPDGTQYRYPQFYTCSQEKMARNWMPCLDSDLHKCPWVFRIVSPYCIYSSFPDLDISNKLKGINLISEDNNDEINEYGLTKFMTIAPGRLVTRCLQDENKILTVYESELSISAREVLISVSAFDYVPMPLNENCESNIKETGPDMLPEPYCFFLPGRKNHAIYTMSFFYDACSFFEKVFDIPLKFKSFKIAFIENVHSPVVTGAGIVFASSYLLLQENIIDQFYVTIRLISRALVSQWISHNLFPETPEDSWLIIGLEHYFSSLLLRKQLGMNEFKYRLRKDIMKVCEMDVDQPPLYSESYNTPEEMCRCPLDEWGSKRYTFVALKSRIVLHMIEKRAEKGFMQKLIRSILSNAISGELKRGISTKNFIDIASRIMNNIQMKSFSEQWIYGCGCPRFYFSYSFNRKKMLVELKFSQKSTNSRFVSSVSKFTGPFTVRIHEPGGTYDTEVCIEDLEKRFDIQYHTKYKRIRRRIQNSSNKFHDQNVQIDCGSNFNEDLDNSVWQQEKPTRLTFEWIRLDPNGEWLCEINFEQSDFMWASQLQKDKDVSAQLEAVYALSKIPSYGTYNVLFDVMKDTNVYYGIRIETANALSKCVSTSRLFSEHMTIIKSYNSDFQCNNKSDTLDTEGFRIREYFVQKSLLNSISQIRDPNGNASPSCFNLIFSLLKYNDNTKNNFSDSHYVANLIECLGNLFISKDSLNSTNQQKETNTEELSLQGLPNMEEFEFYIGNISDKETLYEPQGTNLLEKAIVEVQRYKRLDFLIYSYHNEVTIAFMKVYSRWMKAKVIPFQLEMYLDYTRPDMFLRIRTTAIDIIIELDGINSRNAFIHMLKIILEDRDPYFRYYVSHSLADSLGARTGELFGYNSSSTLARNTKTAINKWLEEREKIISDPEILNILNKAMQTVDQRTLANLARIRRYLYMDYKENDIKEIPKLKIKMIRLKSSQHQHDENGDIHKNSSIEDPNIFTGGDIVETIAEKDHKLQFSSVERKLSQHLLSIVKKFQKSKYLNQKRVEFQYTSPETQAADFKEISNKIENNFYRSDLGLFIKDFSSIIKNDPNLILHFQKIMKRNLVNMSKDKFLQECVATSKDALNAICSQDHESEEAKHNVKSKKPKIRIKVNSTSDVLHELMNSADLRTCLRFWAEIYKSPNSIWLKQDIRDSFTEENLSSEPPKPDYCDMFTMLDNLFNDTYTILDHFQEAFMQTINTLLNKRDIKKRKSIEQITELKAIFMKFFPERNAENPCAARTEGQLTSSLEHEEDISTVTGVKSESFDFNHEYLNKSEHFAEIFGDFAINTENTQVLFGYIEELKIDANSFEFLKPVPKNLYPNYYELITKPMDIATISKKLKSGKYTYVFELESDIRLMFRNCYKYNHPNDPVYIQGRLFERKFDSLWNLDSLLSGSQPNSSAKPKPLKITLNSSKRHSVKASSVDSTGIESQNEGENVYKKSSLTATDKGTRLPLSKTSGTSSEIKNIPSPANTNKKVDVYASPTELNIAPDNVINETSPSNNNGISTDKWDGLSNKKKSVTNKSPQDSAELFDQSKSQPSSSTKEDYEEMKFKQLTKAEKNSVNNFLTDVAKKEYAFIFLEPVKSEDVPGYYDIIKSPIHLNMIKEKLENNEYENLSDFDSDIRLLISNCHTFNPPSSYGYGCGTKFEKFYNLRLKHIVSSIVNRLKEGKVKDAKNNKRTTPEKNSSASKRRKLSKADKSDDAPSQVGTALKITLKLRK